MNFNTSNWAKNLGPIIFIAIIAMLGNATKQGINVENKHEYAHMKT